MRTDSVLTMENQGSAAQTSGMLMSMLNCAMREDMEAASTSIDLMNHQGVQWHFVWKIIQMELMVTEQFTPLGLSVSYFLQSH